MRQWGSRATNDPVLVLNAKEEKLRPKQMDQLPLENCENSRAIICVLTKNSLIAKFGLLWGRILITGKGGSFMELDQFFSWNISPCAQTSVFDLEIGKRIDL